MKYLKPFFAPLAALAAIVLALVWADGHPLFRMAGSPPVLTWAGLGLASCYPHCFCETFRSGGIVEPLSSYSNLFYLLVGLLILGSRGLALPGEPENLMIRRRGYIAGFGAAVIGIGVTSLAFHVSLTTLGRWLDYMGMYAFVSFALLYGLTRFRDWDGKTFLVLFVSLLAVLGLLWVAAPGIKRYLLAGLILAWLTVESIVHDARRGLRIRSDYLYAALVIFLVAFGINVLDEGMLCVPASPWQWHAFWHFLTAIAAGLVFLYYRSEDDSIPRQVPGDPRIGPRKGTLDG
jgi:hypothetical protein